jgi:hypothetical protein
MLLGAGLLVALAAFDDRFKLGVGVRFLGQSSRSMNDFLLNGLRSGARKRSLPIG